MKVSSLYTVQPAKIWAGLFSRLFVWSTRTIDPVLNDPTRAAILSLLCIVESDLTFLREELQIAAARRGEYAPVSQEEIRTHLDIMKEHGYIGEREQKYGQIPWPLTALLEGAHIHIARGSYALYYVTKKGRKAWRTRCRHSDQTETFEWLWR